MGKPAAAALLLLTGAELTEVAEAKPAADEPIDDDLVTAGRGAREDETPVRKTTELPALPRPRALERMARAARRRSSPRTGACGWVLRLSAATTAAALVRTALPLQLRAWLGDELVIRFGVDFTYRPDMPTSTQRALLQTLPAAPARAARPLHAGA